MEKKIEISEMEMIERFCLICMIMPYRRVWTMVSKEKKLTLFKRWIIWDLFADLNEKNRFTDDKDVCEKTKIYYEALEIDQRPNDLYGKMSFVSSTGKQVDDVIKNPPSFDEYQSKFKEMTNREFLKKFIKQVIDLNKPFRAMPKWKRICYAFLAFVARMSGISNLSAGILARSKLMCFSGILIMCAWAGLICSLVFHLSLALLIPSAIILGFVTIGVLANIVRSQMMIYKVRQKCEKDIDDFFKLVDEINQYLDTHDLPPKEISSGEQIFDKSQINEKIKNADMNKENNVTTEENDDKKSEKSKNK